MSDWRWALDYISELAEAAGVSMSEIKHLQGDPLHEASFKLPKSKVKDDLIERIDGLERTNDVSVRSNRVVVTFSE